MRRIALTVSFLLVGAISMTAQSHSPTHQQGRPHGPGHVRPDPAQHDAMHRLLGNWHGTSSSRGHDSQKLHLAAVADKEGKVALKLDAAPATGMGSARDLAIDGSTIKWVQDVSGSPCKAQAVLSAATPLHPETMRGTFACQQGDITFVLERSSSF